MPDVPQDHAAVCSPGCAIVERIGWEDGTRFTATLIFPNGPPDLPLRVVWRMTPVRLVVVEESDNA